MSNAMEKSWKSRLQEYCQKKKLRSPNYRIREEVVSSQKPQFQVEVEVNGRWYTGEENCPSKKEAENSAAQQACIDLIGNNSEFDNTEQFRTDPVVDNNDSSKHFPQEYADVEEYIVTMLMAFGGRIRKVKARDARGLCRVEIIGNYRYCNNIQRHHKKNQVYFLVDPVKKIYFQRCHDPDCQGFQSAKQPIFVNQNVNSQREHNSANEHL